MNYTVDDVLKADYFILSSNLHFGNETKTGVRYEIYDGHGGTYYLDDDSNQWSVIDKGVVESEFSYAITDGHIQFHQFEFNWADGIGDDKTNDIKVAEAKMNQVAPNLFNIIEIEKVHQSDPQEYYVSTKVDAAGLEWIQTKQASVEYLAEIATLHNQRDIINRRIEELQDKLND